MASYEKVLVTGATGFIGAHVADDLLGRGIAVKITARSKAKAEQFLSDRPDKKDLLSYQIIEDFEVSGEGLDKAAEGCDGVIHVASPFTYDVTDVKKQLVLPAIAGAKAMMEASKATGTIKRVVLTSSFASVVDVNRTSDKIFTYTGADWNPITYEQSCASEPTNGYRGSKKFAELEAWNFVKENDVKFDLVTLCPPMVFGPVVHPVDKVESLNVSNGVLWSVAAGANPLPGVKVPVWIDVRDLAKAHVECLLRPEASGKRYVAGSSEFFSYQKAADIIRGEFPSWAQDRVTEGEPGKDIEYNYKLDTEPLTKELGIEFTPFQKTVVDSISQFSKIPGANVE